MVTSKNKRCYWNKWKMAKNRIEFVGVNKDLKYATGTSSRNEMDVDFV